MLHDYNIICFSTADWDNPLPTNKQQIMSRLSKQNRILYIESLGLRKPTLSKRDISRLKYRLVKGLKGVRKVSSNLYVFSPLVIPLHYNKLARNFNILYLRATLRAILSKISFHKPILWTYTPIIVPLINDIFPVITVYHCVDEFSEVPRVPAKVVTTMEKDLLTQSDIVFTSSKRLYEAKKFFNPNAHYIPNVADIDHFSKVHQDSLVIPEDISSIHHPIIGFIGAIDDYKIDAELIRYIAIARPQWSLVFIGPIGLGGTTISVESLKTLPNIYFLGEKSYATLPSYIKAFDLCIIPYNINAYTTYVFPLKFYEYLATGKPIVATALPELEPFAHIIEYAQTREEFLNSIENALSHDTTLKREGRLHCAQGHTWEANIKKMSQLIEPLYLQKNYRE